MSRIKRINGEKTSVEIYKMNIVKELCYINKETLKEYLNRLIKEDIMRSNNEYFSIRYFKE